ncbi:MAG: D-alanine--D-alanine ligase [Gemmatimonadota bacterium]|nr:MAG: D-alanine--D-alanine ligase [Gemmatimonadota bacterium]
MGGTSAERDVSLATGREIARALRANGHEVVAIDAAGGRLKPLAESEGRPATGIGTQPPARDELVRLDSASLARRLDEMPEVQGTDVVFVALHGGAGEDGRVQAVLDLVGIPYTGSGPLGSALAMDKLVSKELFSSAGIPTPPWLVAPASDSEVEGALGGFPVVVKPSREGSTVGVSVVRSPGELAEAVERAASYGALVVIERFIPGRELAVGVLGEEALPIVEIRPSHEIYDYECKYTKGMSQYEVPAPLSEPVTRRVQDLAVRAHRVLRLAAYSRVDFRLDDNDEPWCFEANSLPGMTATSLLPKAARAVGVSFEELCERIVQLARENRRATGTRPGGQG